jgi:hypothetical protein
MSGCLPIPAILPRATPREKKNSGSVGSVGLAEEGLLLKSETLGEGELVHVLPRLGEEG